MEICTIGFTQSRAAEIFGKLKQAEIKRMVDVLSRRRFDGFH